MKVSISKDLISKANELAEIIEQRKLLEKREKALKEFWKTKLKDMHESLSLDGIILSLKEKTRTSIDKKLLLSEMGEEFVSEFEKQTTYQELVVVDERNIVEIAKRA